MNPNIDLKLEASETPPANWNEAVAHLPGASILQTSQWAEGKSEGGWRALFLQWRQPDQELAAAALVLRRKIALNFDFWYVPRGPLLDWDRLELRDLVLKDLEKLGKQHHAVFIKIDPDVPTGIGVPGSENFVENPAGMGLLEAYQKGGWRFSPQQIQFANSVWIDLTPDEDELLANMKQRTRYKVRLAEKKGVSVRTGTPSDFELLYTVYAETAARDEFIIREKPYYLDLWQRFFAADMLTPLIAEVEGEMVGAIMLFTYARKSWYIYGMSRDLHREKMPNYLLQWEAMRTAKAHGALLYDLWGAPDVFDESDRMWGVYQFKRGLGGYEVSSPGAWDLPVIKPLYQLFVQALPAFIKLLKRRKH